MSQFYSTTTKASNELKEFKGFLSTDTLEGFNLKGTGRVCINSIML